MVRRLKLNKDVDVVAPGKDHYVCLEFSKSFIVGKDLLNVGSWIGNYERLIESFPRKLTSLEVEKEALEVAREAGIKSRLVHGSILSAPFPDGSFDVVTMWAVLEHLPEGTENTALSEINRVLKKGGRLFLSTPNYHWLNNILDPAYFLVNHRHYREPVLASLLEDNGFKVEKLEVKGGIISSLSGIMFYVFKYLFRRKMPEMVWLREVCVKECRKRGYADFYVRAVKV